MTYSVPAPNLYELYGLNPADDCAALGLLLSAKEYEFAQQGYAPGEAKRKDLTTAYSILSQKKSRAEYDLALSKGLSLSWAQLEYLGNYGELADPDLMPHLRAAPSQPSAPTAPAPGPHPFGDMSRVFDASQPAQQPVIYGARPIAETSTEPQRANRDQRMGWAIADFFVVAIAMATLGISDGSTTISTLLAGVAFAAYSVGFEVTLGASPVKWLSGYEVVNATTGRKLTLQESAKRQWFRIITIVPGLGQLAAMVAAAIYAKTISAENNWMGTHDELVNAVVVKRKRSSKS